MQKSNLFLVKSFLRYIDIKILLQIVHTLLKNIHNNVGNSFVFQYRKTGGKKKE